MGVTVVVTVSTDANDVIICPVQSVTSNGTIYYYAAVI